jgi:predicted HAD superfamily hydrolase
MDKEEAILTLQKNKLDLEHEALLQDRNVILITEVGLPLTVLNIIVTAQLYSGNMIGGILIVSGVLLAVIERFRRSNEIELKKKRRKIDTFLKELQGKTPKKPRDAIKTL